MTENAPIDEPTPDQAAAHQLLTELRTRIATQPLPYQHGVEERALESLYEVFAQAREAMKDHPGCQEFAQLTTNVLNTRLRWLTAKWHRAKEEGLLRSRDGGDLFRGDLAVAQAGLREFAAELGQMAYGAPVEDDLIGPPISDEQLDAILVPLQYSMPRDPEQNGGIHHVVDEINRLEAEHIAQRRTQTQANAEANADATGTATATAKDGLDAAGLALSGGGIRSAVFCLGVTQVLADRGLIPHFDYLSTVSGGGYTGSFLTMQLADKDNKDPRADLGAPHGPDPQPIRTLRRNAKFLVGGSQWTGGRMALETLLGMLFNWFGPLALIGLCAIGAILLQRCPFDLPSWNWVASIATAITLVAGFWFFVATGKKHSWAKAPGWIMATSATVAFVAIATWAIDIGFGWLLPEMGKPQTGSPLAGLNGPWWTLKQLANETRDWPMFGGDGASWLSAGALAAAVPALLRFLPLLQRPMVRKSAMVISLSIGGVLVPALAILLFYALYALGSVYTNVLDPTPTGLWLLVGGTVILLVLVRLGLNINVTGPHRLYRRGLNRTFVDPVKEGPPTLQRLSAVDPQARAPYHLLNATVNLPASNHPRLRDRKSDFFLFSKAWMGSPVVGYQRTGTWCMDGAEPDLATAMAISGAAVSSSMGLGSIAPLRALLGLLNVRLGYWIHQPAKEPSPPTAATAAGFQKSEHTLHNPDFRCLLREMTGVGMTEKRPWLNLSDGGHIENMAVYELLRRRCKFIVCVDGEGDPGYAFPGLMTLVRHAQVDLGIEIQPNLEDLRPDPETGLSRSHYHFCRIHYPRLPEQEADGAPQPIGLLLYLKLSLTGNESELIQRYQKNNPSFPMQTTLDQFFDEEQFEAYRQLGVHAAEGLFSRTLLDDRSQQEPEPTDVADWFRRLAGNLLTPEI